MGLPLTATKPARVLLGQVASGRREDTITQAAELAVRGRAWSLAESLALQEAGEALAQSTREAEEPRWSPLWLTPQQRRLWLELESGKTPEEIGAIMGRSPSDVRVMMARMEARIARRRAQEDSR